MNQLIFLLSEVNTKITAPGAAASAAGDAAATTANTTAQAAPSLMQNPMMMIVLYCVVIFGALYFFSIKPQKKREKAAEQMRNQIKPGDSVLLNNGMYGRIVDVTAECFIIEFGTNKGIRIPVIKQEIAGVREPNLTNKVEEVVEEKPEKKSLFGKKKEEGSEQK